MPYEELQGWYKFLQARPIGWREDNRASMMIRFLSMGKPPEPKEIFGSISQMINAQNKFRLENKSPVPRSFVDFLRAKAVGDDKEWNPQVE